MIAIMAETLPSRNLPPSEATKKFEEALADIQAILGEDNIRVTQRRSAIQLAEFKASELNGYGYKKYVKVLTWYAEKIKLDIKIYDMEQAQNEPDAITPELEDLKSQRGVLEKRLESYL